MELDCVVFPESSAYSLLSFLYLIVLQGVARIGDMNNLHWDIKWTESAEQSWNGKLIFFISADAEVARRQEYFVPFCRWKNMSFPTVAGA